MKTSVQAVEIRETIDTLRLEILTDSIKGVSAGGGGEWAAEDRRPEKIEARSILDILLSSFGGEIGTIPL